MQFNINFSRFYDKHFGNQISAHDNYDVFAWTDSFSLLFKTQLIKYWNAISFITNSRSLFKLMSIELVMPSNHLIFCRPLLFPPSIFPSIRVFSNGISASASVLPMNIQGWFLSFFFLSFFFFFFFLISFRMNRLDLLAAQETLKSLLQHIYKMASVLSDSLWPCGLQSARLLCPWILQETVLEWVTCPPPEGDPCLGHLWITRLFLYHWCSLRSHRSHLKPN